MSAPTVFETGLAEGAVSKEQRLARLSNSAIELFARQGFEGASLRDIATHADVPLSMIDRYFGSKIDLFNEIQRHIWKQVNVDRDALLSSPIATKEDGSPTLEAVLHALIYPVVPAKPAPACLRRGAGTQPRFWIPACAGMTTTGGKP